VFPALKKSASKFDYGEANEGGNWFIYDIQIKPLANVSNLPPEILGNWFNTNTRNWEISLFDTLAVYNSQLWSYNDINLKKGTGSIKLQNNSNSVELFIKLDKSGNCNIGQSEDKLETFTRDLPEISTVKIDEKPYELLVFKHDTATYSGYLKGYSPRFGGKTFSIYVDDIITGNQNVFIGLINDNGYFTVKIPLYYPHFVYVRSNFFNSPVYLEPGKDVFQILNSGNADNSPLFMGASGKINNELQSLNNINSLNYDDLMNKVIDMKPADYKLYFKKIYDNDIAALNSIYKTNTIGVKAYQIKRLGIEYNYFQYLMSYDMYFESAYREKYQIPRTQRDLPVVIDSPTAEYFDFITSENVNNPLAVISSSYDSFINRLKYLNILRSNSEISLSTYGIVEGLQKSGYIFTESEKILIENIKKQEEIINNPEIKAFNEKYGKQQQAFNEKYLETLQVFYQNANADIDAAYIEKYLKNKGVKLTKAEKQLLKAQEELSKKMPKIEFGEGYSDSLKVFHEKHNEFVNDYLRKLSEDARNENLEKIFGVKKGFATDIMSAQDACRKIVEEVSPVSDVALKEIQNNIVTPFISDYIAWCNQQSLLRIEANKKKGGYVLNEVPKTEADALFDNIMEKYKGKIVYVDFWATWCGPCRSGIEQIKSLKEEMDGKDVVFVYITGPTSPASTYKNMIPDIKGEHYRVSDDEWNYLSSKFNIVGIPHYVLVGKNGEVISPNLGHMDNSSLKVRLEKLMNE
ncbi:MAG: TlpA family protein disulfide reductase, partial [Bacteroidales bacterium]|nr:TlpA family protein disulfide reductase [Bacteroidales bacterium]